MQFIHKQRVNVLHRQRPSKKREEANHTLKNMTCNKNMNWEFVRNKWPYLHEKMFSLTHNKSKANENYTEIPPLTNQIGKTLKFDIIFCWKTGEKAKWYNNMGKNLTVSSKIPRKQGNYQRLRVMSNGLRSRL